MTFLRPASRPPQHRCLVPVGPRGEHVLFHSPRRSKSFDFGLEKRKIRCVVPMGRKKVSLSTCLFYLRVLCILLKPYVFSPILDSNGDIGRRYFLLLSVDKVYRAQVFCFCIIHLLNYTGRSTEIVQREYTTRGSANSKATGYMRITGEVDGYESQLFHRSSGGSQDLSRGDR